MMKMLELLKKKKKKIILWQMGFNLFLADN